MPTSAYGLLILGLFGIAWLLIAWRSHLPLQSRPAVPPKVSRLLKPRTPLDCPACCSSVPYPTLHAPVRAPVRPWCEIKSRRGAPKRIPTQGFACPMPTCPYDQITDAHVHALVGDGSHGTGERIQTFRCQACRTTFSARRTTPLYRLKTPTARVVEVLTALCEGLDVAAAGRVFGYHPATITAWLTRAGEQSARLHHRTLQHLTFAQIQLDERRTRLRCRAHVLWLRLAIDPQSQGHPSAAAWTPDPERSSCRDPHAPPAARSHLSPCVHQRWVESLLLCTDSPFWGMGGGKGTTGTPLAGGSRADLWSGQEDLSVSPTGARHPADVLWDSRGSTDRPQPAGAERAAQYGLSRTREPDPATKCFRFDPPQLVDGEAGATAPAPS